MTSINGGMCILQPLITRNVILSLKIHKKKIDNLQRDHPTVRINTDGCPNIISLYHFPPDYCTSSDPFQGWSEII